MFGTSSWSSKEAHGDRTSTQNETQTLTAKGTGSVGSFSYSQYDQVQTNQYSMQFTEDGEYQASQNPWVQGSWTLNTSETKNDTKTTGGRKKGPWGNTNTWNTKSNADLLRKNMEGVGIVIPKDWHAHHIVSSTDRRSIYNVLNRAERDFWKIDINDPANGIELPEDLHLREGLHAEASKRAIFVRLATAHNRVHAIAILREIASQIANGTWPYLKRNM